MLSIAGCKKPSSEEISQKNGGELTLQTKIANGLLVTQYYPTQIPKEIYLLNNQNLKDGYAYYYHDNGVLIQITHWQNGEKHGEELIYDHSGKLKEKYSFEKGIREGHAFLYNKGTMITHQIFESGKIRYEGFYKGQEKYLNKLYPLFIEEFFFEDKYYAKLRFPMDYRGQIIVKLKDRGSPVIEQLEEHTFQLVINDALDLNGFELELSYHPAPSDTLVYSHYFYPHLIYTTD